MLLFFFILLINIFPIYFNSYLLYVFLHSLACERLVQMSFLIMNLPLYSPYLNSFRPTQLHNILSTFLLIKNQDIRDPSAFFSKMMSFNWSCYRMWPFFFLSFREVKNIWTTFTLMLVVTLICCYVLDILNAELLSILFKQCRITIKPV